jgi:hypothetical protein
MISEPMLCLVQTVHLSCTDTNTFTKWIKTRFHITHVTFEFHRVRPKQFSEAVVLSAQTVRLTCVKISTISKWTESSIHWCLFAYEYDQVRAKRFRSLRNVWHKPCTYVAPTLTLSPIGPKRDSTWPTSSISSIRCVHNDFRASSTFDANRAPILGQDYNYLQTNRI